MDVQSTSDSTCPFCPFFDPDSDLVAQHIQYCHPENESQVESKESCRAAPKTDPEDQFSAFSGQGDESDLESRGPLQRIDHMVNLEKSNISNPPFSPLSHVQSKDARNKSASFHPSQNDPQIEPTLRMSSKKTLNRSIKRLGRAELGPYAHEKKMPSWLLRMLDRGNTTIKLNRITSDGKLSKHVIVENETPNVIPVLARLCRQDESVQRAFLCSVHVHHISKMPREGGFCGYRNIQMLVSYMQGSRGPGSDHFRGALPTILQLQDMIEHAWDMGYNSVGRTETGGIKGTRKYIGTSEAQALFLSLGIQCEASSIGKAENMPSHTALLSHIAAYFKSAYPLDEAEKVVLTNLPPIYFQHHGHSMTIVGFEIRDQGSANVLVFDPNFKTPSVIKHGTKTKMKASEPARILKGYRKGVNYLQKYQTFELLKLSVPGIPPAN
ncbi:peptidase family C78-domain-containing protein [Aspergillus varians]